jgi:pSer/pThr/pTyr-binding forkhead associated (FHA) protein
MNPAALNLIPRLALSGLLYAFLGLLLYYLWKDLRSTSDDTSPKRIATLTLHPNLDSEMKFSLDEINLLGRAADNTIIIEEDTVSAHHARLSYIGKQWWIEDLGSRNGTLLNQLKLTEPLIITHGDELFLGNIRLHFSHEYVNPTQND